ncbi:uncharacterized protein LOC131524173 [Onychostoma macrolepis]|uniref:uncharacterized protein LOC131524173 n=1 Tax=Onychostoma macrolepis TaxID=369639 RepID=UPI002729AA3D|nr:uncharacterized protein LOC131524173 [Onychostoma macrolepis]
MDDPACLLLMLEQRSFSLEDHTRLFVEISNYTHYPDYCLCTFYQASLNDECRAWLSGDGPRGDFATFVEWVLVSCGSPLTVDFENDDTSPTPDPEPSPPSPRAAERQPEPTADGEPAPIATHEPSQEGATELEIALEPEPHGPSDQVREPATSHATVEVTVEREGAEESPAHCTAAEVAVFNAESLFFISFHKLSLNQVCFSVRIRSYGGSAPRDDVYSPDRQRRPGHPDDPQRYIPSENLD